MLNYSTNSLIAYFSYSVRRGFVNYAGLSYLVKNVCCYYYMSAVISLNCLLSGIFVLLKVDF